jgi:hypothetical protein
VPQGFLEQAESVTSKFASPPSLPGWLQEELPYQRRIFQNDDHETHFIDEGTGPVVLLQHGNPTWCFLWRKVIRILLKGNVRVVAPDLVGLGLSDKPRDAKIHTLSFHADRIGALAKALGLQNVTIVGQERTWLGRGPIDILYVLQAAEPCDPYISR